MSNEIEIHCKTCNSVFSNEFEEYAEPQVRCCPYCSSTRLEKNTK